MSIGLWKELTASWLNNDLVAAVDLNDIEHDVNYVHGLLENGVRVYKSSNTSIGSSKTWTGLTFNSERYDDFTEAEHFNSATDNQSLITQITGKYLIFASAQFAANTTGYLRQIRLRRDRSGTVVTIAQASFPVDKTASPTQPIAMTVETVCNLQAGDKVKVEVWQDSGGSLNIEYHSADRYTPDFGMTLVQDG